MGKSKSVEKIKKGISRVNNLTGVSKTALNS